jgi:hypothetical protein
VAGQARWRERDGRVVAWDVYGREWAGTRGWAARWKRSTRLGGEGAWAARWVGYGGGH